MILDEGAQSSGYAMRGRHGGVVEAVGSAIAQGMYPPGDILPKEAVLAQEFDVSRTSVREAMKVLAAKGMLDIRKKVGTRVRPSDQWNVFDSDIVRWHIEAGQGNQYLADFVEIRQVMEPQAARLAAGRATIEDLSRLSRALHEMTAHAQDQDAYDQADVAFHLAIYAASHNALLQQFGSLVADFLRLSFRIQQQSARHHHELDVDVDRHAAVYQAIHRGHGELAADMMLDVVLAGKAALIETLNQQTSG